MSRSYKKVKLKKDRVYSVGQLSVEYSVTANTVSNWVGEGLSLSDNLTPHLFRGAAVQEFHKRKRSGSRRKLQPAQFQCRGCQSDVFPKIETVEDFYAKNGKHMFSARCPNCSFKLQKISGEADRDLVEDCRNPNTPTDCLHEENTSKRGSIWTYEGNNAPFPHAQNDRIIHKWQTYAGGYSEKTIDKHLAAIRYFETFLEGKRFSNLTTDDFAAFRDELKRRANVGAQDSMSASSIKHTVSHVANFFDWLLKQEGYRRLPRDFAGYLKLPKAVLARSAQVKKPEFPSLLQAEKLLNAMPSKSLADQRARAIFALAFLGSLRADTLVSLRIKHIEREGKLILQDAGIVRAKGGKYIKIFWFQIPVAFENVVLEWRDTLIRLGYSGDDALFPNTKYLTHRIGLSGCNAATVPVMSTVHAVTNAFAVASQNSDTKYTPHAAKHTIGAERDIRPLTHEQRKAWSLNMGHDSEQTTERHYGTMTDDRRFEVLESISKIQQGKVLQLSSEEKVAIFDAVLERFSNG